MEGKGSEGKRRISFTLENFLRGPVTLRARDVCEAETQFSVNLQPVQVVESSGVRQNPLYTVKFPVAFKAQYTPPTPT